MPEGPEVKLFVDKLKNYENKKIRSINFMSGRFLKKSSDISAFIGQKFNSISCKGKFIWFECKEDIIFNTLGMTGSWSLSNTQHSRISVEFESDEVIYFNDMRSFGTFQVKNRKELDKKLKSIGPDMLSDPPPDKDFIKRLRKKNNKNICEVLMNQSVISGIGNYIKAESLWLSRIYPFAAIKDLTDDNLRSLYYAVLFVIRSSYASQGATLQTYYTFDDEKGSYVDQLYIYGKNKDWHGYDVIKTETPDKRTTHYSRRQTIGKPNELQLPRL